MIIYSNKDTVSINFWDSIKDDGSTYAIVESELDDSISKEILIYTQKLMKEIAPEIETNVILKDPLEDYPHLRGTEHERFLISRWELILKNITKEIIDDITNQLNSSLNYRNFEDYILDWYSES